MHNLVGGEELNEAMNTRTRGGRRVIDEAEVFHRKYRKQMNELDQYSVLSKVRNITPYDYFCLGSQLNMFEEYLRVCETDGSLNQLGPISDVAFDVKY